MSQVQNSLFEIDVSEMRAFFNRMHQAGTGDLRKAMQRWLEGIGLEFLRIIQDEIIRRQVVDTRMLLQSFQKDDDNNVWTLSEEDLELEVGTTLEYASYVNDGHRQRPGRFVPAIGKRLVRPWVPGQHMAEKAEQKTKRASKRLLSRIIVAYLERGLR